MEKIRYGIIGAGMMGREHIQNILLLDNAEVTAIAEPDTEQQQLSSKLLPRAQVYHHHRELLSDKNIDALVIASPNYTHIDILKDIFTHDARPVLVEKPLCTSYEDCKFIAGQLTGFQDKIWVAMEYRYMEAIRIFCERIRRGDVGPVRMIRIQEHRFPFLKKVGNWNRFEKNSGGTMVEKCCHFFDLMRLIAGEDAIRIYASGAADVNFLDEDYDGRRPDIIDNAFAIVDFQSGMRASLELNMFCDGSYYQEEISVLGDLGKLEVKIPGPDRLWAVDDLEELGHSTGFSGEARSSRIIYSPRKPKGPVVEEIYPDTSLQEAGDHLGSTFYQHQKFNAVVGGRGTVEVGLEDGLKSVIMGLVAERSIKEHRAIDVWDTSA